MTAPCRYAVAPGLRWAHFDDGTVVYVGSTCETHALAPEFAALFGAPATALLIGADAGMPAEGEVLISPAFAEQLVQLKILCALH